MTPLAGRNLRGTDALEWSARVEKGSGSGCFFIKPYQDCLCHVLNSPGKEELNGVSLSEIGGIEVELCYRNES